MYRNQTVESCYKQGYRDCIKAGTPVKCIWGAYKGLFGLLEQIADRKGNIRAICSFYPPYNGLDCKETQNLKALKNLKLTHVDLPAGGVLTLQESNTKPMALFLVETEYSIDNYKVHNHALFTTKDAAEFEYQREITRQLVECPILMNGAYSIVEKFHDAKDFFLKYEDDFLSVRIRRISVDLNQRMLADEFDDLPDDYELPDNSNEEDDVEHTLPQIAEDELVEPDLSQEELKNFGYRGNMHGYRADKAKELFLRGIPVFKLYEDDTEELVAELWEIEEHGDMDGIFGIQSQI